MSVSHSTKSSKRAMSYSSDDSSSEKVKSKHRHSCTHRKKDSHKKSKTSNRDKSETSSENGQYESRKENKHKRKKETQERSEKLKYDKSDKNEKESLKREHYDSSRYSSRIQQSDVDHSTERRKHGNSKSLEENYEEREKQRFGKWNDADDYETGKKERKKLLQRSEDAPRHFSRRERHSDDENNRYAHKNRQKIIRYDDDKDSESDSNQTKREKTQKSHNRTDDESRNFSWRENQKHRHQENDSDEREREKSERSRQRAEESENYSQKENRSSNRRHNLASDGDRNRNNADKETEEKMTQESDDPVEPLSKRAKIETINMRTGGAYIPPARLRMMQESIQDKNSEEYQRIAWEALKKSIIGMTNKVNNSNIGEIVQELFKENIIRGRGVLARAIMQAQAASPTFTKVYAALVAVINSKFPEIGELILRRLIIQYKRGFRRNDKTVCMNAARFLAHLFNQEVAHEILILEVATHLLENPTEDSVEIAIALLKECGRKLTQLSARGMRAITDRVRNVLHSADIAARVQYMIEVFFAVQKDGYKDFETIPPELDLLEEEDKATHLLTLEDGVDGEDILNVFKFDPNYLENEEKYKDVAKEILGDSDEEGGESGEESGSEEEEEKTEENSEIIDKTETNIVCLRRKIYLTIQSSLDFEECAHKLLKLELKPGQIMEMCYMILDCCAQQRTYEKFYGLLAQRFCQLNKIYVEPFTEIFQNSYSTIHRLETNKLRNVAKFFAHLLYTDAISWDVLSIIKLNEEDTTSSSRIFIKILFQELCEYMGLPKLNNRVKDVTLQEAFEGLFPRDLPHNTRFAINFFTSIGLGGLTDDLREHLKNLPKKPIVPIPTEELQNKSSSSSSSPSSSSSSSSSSSDSSD